MGKASAFLILMLFITHLAFAQEAKEGEDYNKDLKYLEVKQVYNTSKKKKKYEKLKQKFLETWLDSNSCYRGNSVIQKSWWEFYQNNTKEVNVINILHSPNYDTLLVLVTWYAVEFEGQNIKNERSVAVGMGVTIDSLGNWKYNCQGGTHWVSKGSPKYRYEELSRELKLLVIHAGYLTKEKTPDPAFWRRIYQNPDVWK